MTPPTPQQVRMRERVESVIRLAAPGLNLLLAAGDRISRLTPADYVEPARLAPPESRRIVIGADHTRMR